MGQHKNTVSMESNTRKIRLEPEQNPQYIVFTRKVGGVAEAVDEYMTYHPELIKILMQDCLMPYRVDGYLRFRVIDGGSETRFSIYDLALGCYSGRVNWETFLYDIQRFLAEKRFYGLAIDHADNIIYNHTIHNLSLMTGQENRQKSDIVTKFKIPARVSVSYVDGKYRVFAGNVMKDTSRLEAMLNCYTQGLMGRRISFETAASTEQYFICEDTQKLIQCLRFISENIVAGCEPIKTDKGNWKPDGECWYMDIHKSIAEQERLAALEPESFGVF